MRTPNPGQRGLAGDHDKSDEEWKQVLAKISCETGKTGNKDLLCSTISFPKTAVTSTVEYSLGMLRGVGAEGDERMHGSLGSL